MSIVAGILIAVLGAALGSFFNVLIDRIPRGESVVNPPSHCISCGKSLPAWQNIPILSYILQKGKCKSCGAKIHWHHLAVEIATPLLFLTLFFLYGVKDFFFWKYLVMFGFLIPIFFIDAFHKIIPLKLSLPMVGVGLLLSLWETGFVFSDFFLLYLLPVLGLFAVLYLLALAWEKLFKKEGLGGGDVILIPAVAAYFGMVHIPFVILLACLMGILYFLIFIRKLEQAFAFGNFIALAAVIWAFIGKPLLQTTGFLRL